MTFTLPVLPACFTASAAPGTAGEQMAMISFRFGYALSSAVASLCALSFRSSHGRSATIFMFGYFADAARFDVLLPFVHVRGGEGGGDDGELAFALRTAARLRPSDA